VEALYSVLAIIIIDLVLSGDNAVVIGMAAHRLPPSDRRTAIALGGGAAIVLRVILTVAAGHLLQISGLRVIGGLLLIWIAFKLLKQEEESAEGIKAAGSMREAVTTIVIADLVMSTDNVLGVAAAAHNDTSLLVFGLVGSMAIILWMGTVVAKLINKFLWLSYVGAAVIAWTGTMMIFDDPLVEKTGWISRPIAYISAGIITIAITAFAHWFHRVRETNEEHL
jgi:YjbE family integral membrane protein